MAARSSRRTGRVALPVLAALTLAGCTATSLGVTPGQVLGTVIETTLPVVLAGGATTTSTSRPTSRPSSRTSSRRNIPDSPPPTAAASRVLRTAEQYIGVKYVWGGNTPKQGFDCSGFTKYVFAKQGVSLPRTSREQARAGHAIPADFRYLIPGDIMLFAEPGEAISHVAIYAGNGRIIHSSSSNGGVGYTDLETGSEWFVDYFVAARRLQ